MLSYRVSQEQVEPLHAILVACGRDLHERLGLQHWAPPISVERMRAEAESREVWGVLDEHDGWIATFTVGTTPIPAYPPDRWTPEGEPALYLNRLAVLPAHQGKGLGRYCMSGVEERAWVLGCRSVRFDAITGHPDLRGFYKRLGYLERGPFSVDGWPVTCFEKIL